MTTTFSLEPPSVSSDVLSKKASAQFPSVGLLVATTSRPSTAFASIECGIVASCLRFELRSLMNHNSESDTITCSSGGSSEFLTRPPMDSARLRPCIRRRLYFGNRSSSSKSEVVEEALNSAESNCRLSSRLRIDGAQCRPPIFRQNRFDRNTAVDRGGLDVPSPIVHDEFRIVNRIGSRVDAFSFDSSSFSRSSSPSASKSDDTGEQLSNRSLFRFGMPKLILRAISASSSELMLTASSCPRTLDARRFSESGSRLRPPSKFRALLLSSSDDDSSMIT